MYLRQNAAAAGLILAVLAGSVGCAAYRRPETQPAPAPAPVSPPSPAQPTPPSAAPTGNEAARAQALADAVRQVPGVRQAWVVVVGTTAYAGLDLTGETDRQPGQNPSVEAAAIRALEGSPYGIQRALVTTKPEVVQSIQNIERGVREGRPVSQFVTEIAKLAAEMVPTADTTR